MLFLTSITSQFRRDYRQPIIIFDCKSKSKDKLNNINNNINNVTGKWELRIDENAKNIVRYQRRTTIN